MKTTTPEPVELSKERLIWVKKKIKSGDTQCGDCREKATYGETCLEFSKPLKRSRGGRLLRCRACLNAGTR